MITLLLVLLLAGFLLLLFNRFVPIDAKVRSLINTVVIFLLVVYVLFFFLDMFGIYHSPLKFR